MYIYSVHLIILFDLQEIANMKFVDHAFQFHRGKLEVKRYFFLPIEIIFLIRLSGKCLKYGNKFIRSTVLIKFKSSVINFAKINYMRFPESGSSFTNEDQNIL